MGRRDWVQRALDHPRDDRLVSPSQAPLACCTSRKMWGTIAGASLAAGVSSRVGMDDRLFHRLLSNAAVASCQARQSRAQVERQSVRGWWARWKARVEDQKTWECLSHWGFDIRLTEHWGCGPGRCFSVIAFTSFSLNPELLRSLRARDGSHLESVTPSIWVLRAPRPLHRPDCCRNSIILRY